MQRRTWSHGCLRAYSRARSLLGATWLLIAMCVCAVLATAAAAAARQPLLSQATDLGPVNAASPIEITLWMKLHDQQSLDGLVEAQQAGKAAYLSTAQVWAQHAPSRAKAIKVADLLKAEGFTVSGFGPDNLFVRASGTVDRVESAFQVELHQYALNGRSFRASRRSATLPPELVPLVAAVGGLSDLAPEPQVARAGSKIMPGVHRQTDAEGMPPQPLPLSGQPNGLLFSAQCFYPPISVNFSSGATSASYQGNRYGAPITSGPPNLPPCGYQPSDIQTAYNLTPLYKAGLNGAGTTIAIVDAYGSTTIAYDVQAFSKFMGLPPANLTIIGTPTGSNFSTDPNIAGWAAETTLDVECTGRKDRPGGRANQFPL